MKKIIVHAFTLLILVGCNMNNDENSSTQNPEIEQPNEEKFIIHQNIIAEEILNQESKGNIKISNDSEIYFFFIEKLLYDFF
jgi:hypothetical protein